MLIDLITEGEKMAAGFRASKDKSAVKARYEAWSGSVTGYLKGDPLALARFRNAPPVLHVYAWHGIVYFGLLAKAARPTGGADSDAVLRTSIAYRIVQAMRLQWKRGRVESQEKRGGVRIWSLRP